MKIYLIRNDQGLYFRPRGRHSSDTQWVSIEKAKHYNLSEAKKRLNFVEGTICEYELVYLQDLDISKELEEKKKKKEEKQREMYKIRKQEEIERIEERIHIDQLYLETLKNENS